MWWTLIPLTLVSDVFVYWLLTRNPYPVRYPKTVASTTDYTSHDTRGMV